MSSHAPWPIIPEVIGWDQVGDGSVYHSMTTGEPRDAIWAKGSDAVRTAYRRSLEYSINSLISWVETYGSEDTVVIMLGDHQPAPLLTGPGAGRDVPITIIAGDHGGARQGRGLGLDVPASGPDRRHPSGGWTPSATGSSRPSRADLAGFCAARNSVVSPDAIVDDTGFRIRFL